MHPKIVFWGKGRRAEQAMRLMDGFEVSAVIESDATWHGKMWHGVKVVSFETYLAREEKPPILVTPAKYEGIVTRLEDEGIEKYLLFNDFVLGNEEALFPELSAYGLWEMEKNWLWGRIINESRRKETEMLTLVFYHIFLQGSRISTKALLEKMSMAKAPVVNVSFMEGIMSIICGRQVKVSFYGELPMETDLVILHGMALDYLTRRLAIEALRRGVPILFTEDAFLRSIEPRVGRSDKRFMAPYGAIIDKDGLYINAYAPSSIENILNSDWKMDGEQAIRTEKVMAVLKWEQLSKYNCQHEEVLLQDSGKARVLVIDQVYGDKSIALGMADDESTFKIMMESAMEENPEAEIYIKAHPVKSKGHFANMPEDDRLHILAEPMNPIKFLQQMDKVYVVSSQMGFEAVMCGCEVHCFGMPFYAGWGITNDRMVCERREKNRTVEEVFYAAYIMATTYVSYKKNSICEIEQVMEELLELRKEYFMEESYRYF